MKTKVIFILAFVIWSGAFAREDGLSDNQREKSDDISRIEEKLQGFEESYLETKTAVDKLKKIKVSGYIQAQMRIATDTAGLKEGKYKIGKFQGGEIPANARTAFQIRRGRFKIAYEADLSQMVVQLDCVPGSVSIKDAYLRFSEPWLKSLAVKAGVFDRPFGFEISYSSSSRESPERSRIFQTLFPGERDMGISFEYSPSDNLPLWAQLFNVKFGAFAGNGINNEFDDVRDLIGRFGLSIPLNNINLAIDAGFSGYAGAVKSFNDTAYEVSDSRWVTRVGKKNDEISRQYTGGDVELYYGDIPLLGGFSLRSEIIGGQQPSRKASSESPKSASMDTSLIYVRNFMGFYGMAVLNIDPLKCQIAGKYDFYDPNVDLKGKEIKNIADARYKTFGFGLIYHWNENVKLMAYYDKVTNEKIDAVPYNGDVKDDVLTFRIQYKF